jgi:hypothetical protein
MSIEELLREVHLVINGLVGAIPPKAQEKTWKNLIRQSKVIMAEIEDKLSEIEADSSPWRTE